jgi:hypothetical protein
VSSTGSYIQGKDLNFQLSGDVRFVWFSYMYGKGLKFNSLVLQDLFGSVTCMGKA